MLQELYQFDQRLIFFVNELNYFRVHLCHWYFTCLAVVFYLFISMKYVLFVQLLPSIKKRAQRCRDWLRYGARGGAERTPREGYEPSAARYETCLFLRSVLQIRPCTVPEKIANEPELDGLQLLPEKNILVVV